jgi:hypothetical protein
MKKGFVRVKADEVRSESRTLVYQLFVSSPVLLLQEMPRPSQKSRAPIGVAHVKFLSEDPFYPLKNFRICECLMGPVKNVTVLLR